MTTSFLDGYLEAVRSGLTSAMTRWVPDREPRRWLYDPLASHLGRGGKALRPALCIAACRAFGGSSDDAMPSALAIELLHNAFLVHDDVEDGSLSRRGAPTLHAEYGVPIAINVGDGLAALGLSPLADNVGLLGASLSRRVAEEYGQLLQCTVEGQAMELGWRRENVVKLTPDDYLEMVSLKTCAYTTIFPLRIGALIGSWGRADLEGIARFGLHLGAAFQIRDDLLNLTATDERYGKEIGGDLAEGKRTLMVIHLLGAAVPSDRSFVTEFLGRADRTPDDAAVVVEMMERYGSLDFAAAYADGIAEAARSSFVSAFGGLPDTPDLRFLRELIDFMVIREA